MNERIYFLISEITNLLQKLEDAIKAEGFSPPENNVSLKQRIQLPRGYFRKAEEFRKKYMLDLFPDKILADNISYHLQYTDFINYILSRTEIGTDGLSIGTVFRKQSIIIVGAICEAYLHGIFEFILERCKECGYEECKLNIVKKFAKKGNNERAGINFKKLAEFFYIIGFLTQEQYENLRNISEKRNHIHIQYRDKNSGIRIRDFPKRLKVTFDIEHYENQNYSIYEYNQAIRNLYELPRLFQNVIDFKCLKPKNTFG